MRNPRLSPTLVDAVFDRYLDWRQASHAVSLAYGTWLHVDREDRASAYADYCDALDAEQRAAEEYQALVERVSRGGQP